MEARIISVPTEKITDRNSFHEVFSKCFGFPEFYGKNMDAWVDCMGYLDSPESSMSSVTVPADGIAIIQLEDAESFKNRCSEQYNDLVECTSFVNMRCVSAGRTPILALAPIAQHNN